MKHFCCCSGYVMFVRNVVWGQIIQLLICKNLYQLSLFSDQHWSYMKLVNKFPSHRGRSISSPPVKSTSIQVIPGSGRSFTSPGRIDTNVMGKEWKFSQHILKRKRTMMWYGRRSDNTNCVWPCQRPKKSELSGWQLSTRKTFQTKCVNCFRDKKSA